MRNDVNLQAIFVVRLVGHESSLMRLIWLDSSAKFEGPLQVTRLLDELEASQVVFESLMADLVEEQLFAYLLIMIQLEGVVLLRFAEYDGVRLVKSILRALGIVLSF